MLLDLLRLFGITSMQLICTSGAVAMEKGPNRLPFALSDVTYLSTTVGFCLADNIFCFADLKVQVLFIPIQKPLMIPEMMYLV